VGRERDVIGVCCVCGKTRRFSFEHVPPRRAFNDRPLIVERFKEFVRDRRHLDDLRGPMSQRGLGAHTLCEPCNNLTGHWYGSAFCHWTYQGMRLLPYFERGEIASAPFRIQPLRVIKQIMTMFASTNGPGFCHSNSWLKAFILQPRLQWWESDIRLWAAFATGDRGRTTGIMASMTSESWRTCVLSEIAFPPFVYALTFDSLAPDPRFVEISFFSSSGMDDQRELHLPLGRLPIYTPFGGDYRDRETVLREANLTGEPA
jgi:hypothetical protein